MTILRIVALSGSLRSASTNTALLRSIAEQASDSVAVEILPLGGLPLFNPDHDDDPPAPVSDFRSKVRHAQAMLIASPEYAHGVSGVLKNALDWLVGSDAFVGKPVLVLDTAPRARHAIGALREILATMSAQLVDELPGLAASHSTQGGSHASPK